MPKLDAFAAQLVAHVRQMPDEALLALVKNQLGLVGPAPSKAKPTPVAARPKATKRRAAGGAPRAGRAALVAEVEKFVLGSKGVGLADVAKATGASKDRAKAALKQLKLAKRIAYAGDRKYTRYAADTKTALAASKRARTGK